MGAVAAMPAFWGAVSATAGAGAGIYGAHKTSSAANRAADLSVQAADRAATLQAKSAADALSFAKQQEEERKREWEATQARNFGLYKEREAQLQPYRNVGAAAVGQMGRPIPGMTQAPAPGSLGDVVGVR